MGFCEKCGRPLPPDSLGCPVCGAADTAAVSGEAGGGAELNGADNPEGSPAAPLAAPAAAPPEYAGVWLRAGAYLIDILATMAPFGYLAAAVSPALSHFIYGPLVKEEQIKELAAAINSLLMIAYFAALEASAWKGSIGKKVLSLEVVTTAGERLRPVRAIIRAAVKVWLGIGFLLALFTAKKQALHDYAGETVVIKKPRRLPAGLQ